MSRAIFQTRFFIHFFSSPDPKTHELLLELMRRYDRRPVSAITLFEIYKISVEREGKETAETRISRIEREFSFILVDDAIAATGIVHKAVCMTDSPHFNEMSQIKRRWIH